MSALPPRSIQTHSTGTKIVVAVHPNARSNSIEAVDDDAVSVRVAAEAREGRANAELVEFLAAELGVKRRDVSVERGAASHSKVVVVAGKTPAQVHAALIVAFKNN